MEERLHPAFAALAFAACVPVALLHFVGRQQVSFGDGVHFATVAFSSLLATAAALALLVAGARSLDARAVLVGGAFTVMAALLCLHGLTTPGVLMGDNGVVAFTGGATLPIGGALLALGAVPALRRPSAVKPLLIATALLVAGIVGLGLAAVLEPDLVPSVPEPGGPAALTLLVLGLVLYGILALRAWRTYVLARRPGDLVVATGIAWLAAALAAALLLGWWHLGWWLGHGFEVVGILLVAIPVAIDLTRGKPTHPLVGDLTGADLVASEEAYLGSQVRALMVALAEKDGYTEEHVRRVALRAVQVGEELGLSRARLRRLAVGGLLHDMGKLSIPDDILGKPGPLSESEFTEIKAHAERGRDLLNELGGFAEPVLALVHDHHERLDGTGYPRGLGEDDIGLDVRILAACDVYDALISPRVYRPAWTHEQAFSLLSQGVGSEFDDEVVAALGRVLARERGEPLRVPAAV
jgi:HD-GYP domain-containing protein (c-di-GMP phosphodiesterase class II)